MTRVMLVHTSLTGNTRAGAEIVTETLEGLGVEVDVFQGYDADPFDFENYDIAIVGTYTYGTNADLPDEIVDFYEELEDAVLDNKIYGVFGSGDKFYGELYCLCVNYFEEQFEKTGASKGTNSVRYNLDPQEEATNDLKHFAKELFEKHENVE